MVNDIPRGPGLLPPASPNLPPVVPPEVHAVRQPHVTPQPGSGTRAGTSASSSSAASGADGHHGETHGAGKKGRGESSRRGAAATLLLAPLTRRMAVSLDGGEEQEEVAVSASAGQPSETTLEADAQADGEDDPGREQSPAARRARAKIDGAKDGAKAGEVGGKSKRLGGSGVRDVWASAIGEPGEAAAVIGADDKVRGHDRLSRKGRLFMGPAQADMRRGSISPSVWAVLMAAIVMIVVGLAMAMYERVTGHTDVAEARETTETTLPAAAAPKRHRSRERK